MGSSQLPPVGRPLGVASLEEDDPDLSQEGLEEVDSEGIGSSPTHPPGVMNPENALGDA